MASLTAPVTDSDVMWHVDAPIPDSVPWLKIDGEVVEVLAWSMPGLTSGNSDPSRIWVRRAAEGTPAASHLSGATLTPLYQEIGTAALDPGAGGGADKNYVHNQGLAASVWDIAHNLGKRPSVTVVDSGATLVEGDIHYVDDNTVQLTFSAAFAGAAYLN
jgi:hypothetical protein